MRTVITIALWVSFAAAPGLAFGSPGMIGAVVYACHAEQLSDHLVAECSKQKPELASEAASALAAWRSRYGQRAHRAAAICAEIANGAPRKPELEAKLSEFLNDIEQSAKEPSYCSAAIAQMIRPSKEMDGLWSDLERSSAKRGD